MRSAAVNAEGNYIFGRKFGRRVLIWIRQESGKIDNSQVCFFAGVECADNICFAERARAAKRSEIKCLARSKRPQVWFLGGAGLLHFNRRAHHLPHI